MSLIEVSPSPPTEIGELTEREYALDTARGTLMAMGVLMHAANIYALSASWQISDPQQSPFFDFLSWFIHRFRMESFYWISGYFCAMSFQKAGVGGLLRKRLFRIALPLIATWSTLNVAQSALLAWWRGQNAMEAMRMGVPPGHLWFLVDLLIYIVLGALLLSKGGAFMDGLGRRWRWGAAPLLLALTTGTYLLILMVRLSGFAYAELWGITEPLRLASYWPYFATGILMYRVALLRTLLFRPNLLLVLAIAALLSLLSVYLMSQRGRVLIEVGEISDILAKWMLVSGVIGAFQRWTSRPSRVGSFLANASYTIYLFHHLLVIAIGILVMPLTSGPYVKFLIVTAATLLITGAIHHYLIGRVAVLRLLYNGKR